MLVYSVHPRLQSSAPALGSGYGSGSGLLRLEVLMWHLYIIFLKLLYRFIYNFKADP